MPQKRETFVAPEEMTVRVRLLGEPCLWCWTIVDARTGAQIEDSWDAEWCGYASPGEAIGAGRHRLREIAASRGLPAPGIARWRGAA